MKQIERIVDLVTDKPLLVLSFVVLAGGNYMLAGALLFGHFFLSKDTK